MKITKTSAGTYRTVICIGTDENGKRRFKTITAPTKDEVRAKANEAYDRYKNVKSYSDTFRSVALDHMAVNRPITSPNTYREYKSRFNTMSDVVPWFMDKKVYDISTQDVQMVLNAFLKPHVVKMAKGKNAKVKEYVMDPCGPKTVKNYCSYITGVLKHRGLTLPPAKLPEKRIYDIYVPSDEEVKAILENVEGELSICVRLAAFGLLREGEVCALQLSDIRGRVIHVHRDIAYDTDIGMTVKPTPKRSASNRYIECPQSLIDDIMAQGYVTHYSPKTVRKKFKQLLVKSGVHDFRFHDLRHWGASTLHAQGVPDAYIQKRGGWSTVATLQRIYRHTLADQDKKMTELANEHFNKMFSGDTP